MELDRDDILTGLQKTVWRTNGKLIVSTRLSGWTTGELGIGHIAIRHSGVHNPTAIDSDLDAVIVHDP